MSAARHATSAQHAPGPVGRVHDVAFTTALAAGLALPTVAVRLETTSGLPALLVALLVGAAFVLTYAASLATALALAARWRARTPRS